MSCGQRRSLTSASLLLALSGRPSLQGRGGRRVNTVASQSRCCTLARACSAAMPVRDWDACAILTRPAGGLRKALEGHVLGRGPRAASAIYL